MATKVNGRVVSPTSTFQYEVYTAPVGGGPDFLPRGSVGFSKVSGLTAEVEAVEYKEGNDLYSDMIAGRSKPFEVTLEKGLDKSGYLRRWFAAVQERTAVPAEKLRNDVYIVAYERQGTPQAGGGDVPVVVGQWKLNKAWPRQLESGDLTSTDSEINVQRVVLVGYGPAEQQFPL